MSSTRLASRPRNLLSRHKSQALELPEPKRDSDAESRLRTEHLLRDIAYSLRRIAEALENSNALGTSKR